MPENSMSENSMSACSTSEYPKALLQKFFQLPYNPEEQDAPEAGTLDKAGALYEADGFDGGAASELRILGVAPDTAACGHYRVLYPLMLLAEQGAQVSVFKASDKIPLQAFLDANVIYLSRACTDETLQNVLAIRQMTQAAIVYDLDDCLHEVSPSSPAYAGYNAATSSGQATLASVWGFLRAADAAIFSTRELQAYYAAGTRHPHLLFNGLDLSLGTRDWSLTEPRFDWRPVAARQGCAVERG